MTDPTPPGDETPDAGQPSQGGQPSEDRPAASSEDTSFQARLKKRGLTANRLIIWVLVAAFGLYEIITGIVGLITKAR